MSAKGLLTWVPIVQVTGEYSGTKLQIGMSYICCPRGVTPRWVTAKFSFLAQRAKAWMTRLWIVFVRIPVSYSACLYHFSLLSFCRNFVLHFLSISKNMNRIVKCQLLDLALLRSSHHCVPLHPGSTETLNIFVWCCSASMRVQQTSVLFSNGSNLL